MLLAHDPERLAALRAPSITDPWRVLLSGCLAGWKCGVDGSDNGLGGVLGGLLRLPTLRLVAFCPEAHALGTPRTTPDIHGGDGVDVVAGRARVRDEHGADLTEPMLAGARAMLAFALEERVEVAILTDMSAACGSQVVSLGSRFAEPRRYRKGVGVATALLLDAGIAVVSQRDYATLDRMRARLEPGYSASTDLLDHHEHPWTREHLPAPHPRVTRR